MKLRHSLLVLCASAVLPMAHAAEAPKAESVAPQPSTSPLPPSDTVTVPNIGAGQTHFRVMPPKIKPVQTGAEIAGAAPSLKLTPHTALDKLTLADRPSFDADFWEGTDIEDISSFLEFPTPALRDPSLRALMTKAILTPADDTDEDHDVYSLRIAKLTEMGDFSAALALYKLNDQSPPSPLAARAGVESMMGTGEMGVACLEQKALTPALKTDSPDFWAALGTFCQALLGPATESSGAESDEKARLYNAARVFLTATGDKVPADAAALNTQAIPNLIAQIHGGMLNDFLNKTVKPSDLTDKTLRILVNILPLPPAGESPWKREALMRGLNPPQETAIVPSNSIPDKRASLVILIKTNQAIPIDTVKAAYPQAKLPNPLPDTTRSEKLLTDILAEQFKDNTARMAQITAINGVFAEKDEEKLIEKNIYDNIFSLTQSGNYVMPNDENLSNLQKSADKKLAGQVVIDSLRMLSGESLQRIHPAALYKILTALDSAGLNEETVAIARDVLGDIIEESIKEK